ncbi:hypothetical protein KKF84_01825 [Myxococcota bacterium]|nr:hypothetical protein [Myxococcota bacterium]MBU1534024.1 hypothetical protein [Myxococcota bacterium]
MKKPANTRGMLILFISLLFSLGCAKGNTTTNNSQPVCGNGQCETTEDSLSCPEDCGANICGNTMIENDEECDSTNLGGATCVSLGFDGGTLTCSDCSFDIRLCEGCPNACPGAGALRCSGDLIEECSVNGNCLSWVTQTDCSITSRTCDDTGETPECALSCTDGCPTLNDSRCTLSTIETCIMGLSGCLDWDAGDDCSLEGQVCDASSGTAQCAETCSDACPALSDTRCSGDTIEECTMGGNGCLGWTTGTDCTLDGKVCSTGACECPAPVCTLTATQCDGDNLQTCQTGTNGCEEWGFTEDCTVSGLICSGIACACNDQCTTGQHDCNGTYITDCVQNGQGCWVWQDGTNCADTSEFCNAGACTAVLDDYVRSTFSGGYSHVTTSSVGSGDDSRFQVVFPSGFNFSFYGVPYTSAWMCTNGWLSFGSDPGNSDFTNDPLPASGAPNQAVYPFWDDLTFSSGDCPFANSPYLYSAVQGSAPNRVLVFDWYQGCSYDADSPDGKHSFQVRIYETTNVVELLYDCGTWDEYYWGNTATVGIEDDLQTDRWDQVSSSQSSCPSSNYRYTPAPH